MAATVVTVDRNVKAGVMPILVGHWVTFTNFIKSLFLGKAATIQLSQVFPSSGNVNQRQHFDAGFMTRIQLNLHFTSSEWVSFS